MVSYWLLDLGQYEEALAALDELQSGSVEAAVCFRRIAILLYLARYDEAINASDAAIASGSGPLKNGGLFYKTHAERARKNFNQALELSREISTSDTDLAELSRIMEAVSQMENSRFQNGIFRLRADILKLLDRYEDALSALEPQLSARDPFTRHCALEEKGSILYYLGNFREAHETLRAALDLAPYCTPCWSTLAWVTFGMGRDAEALSAIEIALTSDPFDRASLMTKTFLLMQTGKVAEAKDCLATLRKADELNRDFFRTMPARGPRTIETMFEQLIASRERGTSAESS
jgi:tetratricopeptide (TPR) repeat protein